jgi:hypothetical protein
MRYKKLAFLATVFTLCCSNASAENGRIHATIKDISGNAVSGVKLFLYESPNVRKPADFISEQSDLKGRILLNAPKARYWAVARLKRNALYGPLMPGDKHSGEPVEIDSTNLDNTEVEFAVSDILEIGQKKRTSNSDSVKLRGRILDKEGKPVPNAYAFASTSVQVEYIPEYISAWTDGNGNYTLYLPAGSRFFIGAAQQFPPLKTTAQPKEFTTESGKLDVVTDIPLIVY